MLSFEGKQAALLWKVSSNIFRASRELSFGETRKVSVPPEILLLPHTGLQLGQVFRTTLLV
jgi:hypothetical protein